MADVQVTCITKSPPGTSTEHITHIGSITGNWKWTVEEVIKSIENKTNTFFVKDASTGKRADVYVVYPEKKKPYLRTEPDSTKKDNLLSLPSCP